MQKEASFKNEALTHGRDSGSLRQSNIELLRIIAMVFIVMHHYVVHGTTSFVYLDSPLTVQNVFALFLASLGRPAVGIFVLICGYFSIKSDFKLPRFVTLIAQVFSYSVLFLVLAKFVLPAGATIGRAEILASVFPTAYGTYWFMTSYAVLILLSPYINKLLLLLTQKQHKALIVLFAAIWCIAPTILGANFAGSDLAYFVAFYSIAAYFRLYPSKVNPARHFALFGFWALVVLASIASASFLLNYSGVFRKYITYFSEYNRLPGAMCAIELFLAMTQSKPFYSKWINGIAATSFGIYLIHENPFVRPLLWGKWFDSSAYVNTPLYFVHLLASVIIVLVGCAVIDTLFWKLTVGKLFCLLRDKYLDKVIAFLKSLYHAIEKVFVKLI